MAEFLDDVNSVFAVADIQRAISADVQILRFDDEEE
jgi:hypothetical protein